ncbi:uncharacterized protein LOC106672669 [Cimex lectularius]|uniref:Uncharacterized protein n=1 Tax=Cimex lectularius TaxID=79782 RepID=A0A8I6S693_CIMLE|nr:uncharacterized protein LOC106672669 [Cimex lectularius]
MAKQKSHKDKRELPEYLLNRLITIHADLESRKIPETHFITPHPNLEKLLEKNDNKPEPLPGLLQCLRQKPEGKPSKVIADKDSPEIVLKTVGPRVTYHKLPKKRKVVEDRGEQELKKMEDEISDLGKLRGIVHMRDLIARMRVEPTSGFIYLVYALSKEDINFHPFCYQIVSFYDVSGTAGKHFLTMSNQGVIQCVYGESTFYSMDEWDIDYSNWVELIKTRTFWQFQLYKYFTLWRKKITTRKFVENQTSLEASLIMVRPELRNALQQTQSVCESLSKESFFVSSGLEKLNLEEFMNIQVSHLSSGS